MIQQEMMMIRQEVRYYIRKDFGDETKERAIIAR
jgi:hypothetical protein